MFRYCTEHTSLASPDYSKSPYDINHYFDLKQGEVLVGDRLAMQTMRTYDAPDAVRELGGLLLDYATEIDPERYPRLDVNSWDLKQYRRFGTWGHRLVTPPDEPFTNLTEVALERSYHLGIGPAIMRITAPNRFGSYSNFYREIGTADKQSKGRYDQWSFDRFADHVHMAFLTRPMDISTDDYLWVLARNNEGPSPKIIRSHAGRVAELLEARGYPDIRAWDKDTYRNWGGHFMVANNGLVPGRVHIDYLSRKKRGPSATAVSNNIGSLSLFQEQAAEAYGDISERFEDQRNNHVTALASRRARPRTLRSLLVSDHTPDWQAVRMGAQFLLLDTALPDVHTEKKEVLAMKKQRDFERGVSTIIGSARIPQLRQVAATIGVSDDIWPDHNPEHIHVPPTLKAA